MPNPLGLSGEPKNLVYDTLSDTMYMLPCGLMECRDQVVEFRKHIKGGENIKHKARIVTYVDPAKKKAKVISLLTNDMTMEVEDIIDIYRQRWEIELLFKQLKQNFPLIAGCCLALLQRCACVSALRPSR